VTFVNSINTLQFRFAIPTHLFIHKILYRSLLPSEILLDPTDLQVTCDISKS
jgi:hypothetical protein